MFDLSVKDKPRSPFGKLRDKMKGRRPYDLESSSAIVPSSSGALEDDLGLGSKKPKGGSGFFKNRLRKSSLTQSSTSLGSDSTVSSASSMAGVGASEGVAAPSPNRHGSLPTDHCSARDFLLSPKLTHKRAFSDEVSKVDILPESQSVQSLKLQHEPISRSSLCINGSHIYCEEPAAKPAFCPSSASPLAQSRPKLPSESASAGPAPLPSEPPLWSSSSLPRPPKKDPPRFIPSPPILAAQEEDKLSVKTLALSRHRNRVRMDDGIGGHSGVGKPVQVTLPMVFSAEAGKGRPSAAAEEEEEEEKRATTGLFHRGSTRDEGEEEEEEGKSRVAAGEAEREKTSSWFGMKDSRELPQTLSPHPVQPGGASRPGEKRRRSSLPLGPERLHPKSTSGDDSATPFLQLERTEQKRDPSLPDCSAKYHHLTHDELIQLLLKREAELGKKQEHIRELENYIDRLLVRIMEQSPTLLQIPLGRGAKAAK